LALNGQAPAVPLSNGVLMPALGLGTWPMDDKEAERVIPAAAGIGYRLIDTAENYGNEAGVGRGIRASGIDRAEFFVTTKFNVKWHGFDEVQDGFKERAAALGLDYVDLLLIHWPNPSQGRFVDAWRGMIKLLEAGKVRAIGVSNFKPAHIQQLIDATGVVPHVNQVQLNPRIPRGEEQAYHAQHGIVTETWAPLARGRDLLEDPVLQRIAQAHARTVAQVILRWQVQQGLVPVPKSSDPGRLAQNIDVFDFNLSADDMNQIASLDRGGEGAADSDRMGH
jgi:2,5-diketo-D-gluconate reductase A